MISYFCLQLTPLYWLKAFFKLPLLLSVLAIVILSSCATQPNTSQQANQAQQTTTSPDKKVATLLAQAATANPQDASRLSLRAGQILMATNNLAQASALLYKIQPDLLSEQNDKIKLVFTLARLAMIQEDTEEAWAILNSPRYQLQELDEDQLASFELLKSELHESTYEHLAAIKRRTAISNILPHTFRQKNRQAIWENCLNLGNPELNQAISLTTGETRAWLELAAVYRYHQNNLENQIKELDTWLNLNANHPGARNLPRALEALRLAAEKIPRQVAVLLPAEGRYKVYAKAILDGITAKHYMALENKLPTYVINFYNTASIESFMHTYRRAVDEGAELIIGPLQKENVIQLQELKKLPVPTLALNYTDLIKKPDQLFFFGLSAENEVVDIAKKAEMDGHHQAAIIYPESEWGKRVMSQFTKSWYDTNGEIIISQPYDKSQPLGQYIKTMLNINESESRANRIRWMTSEKLEFEARRRQDIDFILLLATPKQARQIKPALNFHFANNVPVYATSHVYEGQTDKDQDLNGILFLDMPWVLTNDYPLKNILSRDQPNTQLQRLTALGIDAYSLIARLSALEAAPDSRVYGTTGILQLKKDHTLSRQLDWAYFYGGKARLLPTIVKD